MTATSTVTVTATGTSTLTPSPANACGSALSLGSIGVGFSATESGVNVGNIGAFYVVTFPSGISSGTLTVADSLPGSGVPAGSDVMSVYTDSFCQDLAGGSSSAVATYTTTTPGTYYVKVFEGSGGADGGFTLTASAS